MSRRSRIVPLLLVVLPLAAGLAACGDEKPDRKALLSSSKAAELRSTLDGIEQMVKDGDCEGAGGATLALRQQVNALPASVDASLRDALGDGANRLETLVADRCEPQPPATAAPPAAVPEGPTEPQEEEGKKPKKEPKGKAKGHDKQQQGTEEDGTPTVPEEQTGGAEG